MPTYRSVPGDEAVLRFPPTGGSGSGGRDFPATDIEIIYSDDGFKVGTRSSGLGTNSVSGFRHGTMTAWGLVRVDAALPTALEQEIQGLDVQVGDAMSVIAIFNGLSAEFPSASVKGWIFVTTADGQMVWRMIIEGQFNFSDFSGKSLATFQNPQRPEPPPT